MTAWPACGAPRSRWPRSCSRRASRRRTADVLAKRPRPPRSRSARRSRGRRQARDRRRRRRTADYEGALKKLPEARARNGRPRLARSPATTSSTRRARASSRATTTRARAPRSRPSTPRCSAAAQTRPRAKKRKTCSIESSARHQSVPTPRAPSSSSRASIATAASPRRARRLHRGEQVAARSTPASSRAPRHRRSRPAGRPRRPSIACSRKPANSRAAELSSKAPALACSTATTPVRRAARPGREDSPASPAWKIDRDAAGSRCAAQVRRGGTALTRALER